MLDGILVLFLPYKTHGVGVFFPARTQLGIILLKESEFPNHAIFLQLIMEHTNRYAVNF